MKCGLWPWLLENLGNREIASGIWLGIILAYMAFSTKLRKPLAQVAIALLNWKLIALFGSLAGYVFLLCWLLLKAHVWSIDQLPATVLWYLFSGTFMLGGSLSPKGDQEYFGELARDVIKITVIFEFVVVAYSFSLIVELFFVPFLVLLGLSLALSETRPELSRSKSFLQFIAAGVTLLLFWHSAKFIWIDPPGFFSTQTGRNLILPILLTVGSLPLFYCWYCISSLENARIQIDLKTFQSPEVRKYAQRKFFWHFFLRPWLLRRATRQFHSIPAETLEDVDLIVIEIRGYEQDSKDPPLVMPNDGWSPHLAKNLLSAYGLATGDYHLGGDENEWWAISKTIDLDAQILPNTITFSLEGTRWAVSKLKLKGHFLDDFSPDDALEKFGSIALRLVEAGLNSEEVSGLGAISANVEVDVEIAGTKVRFWSERFPSGRGFNRYATLTRGTEHSEVLT